MYWLVHPAYLVIGVTGADGIELVSLGTHNHCDEEYQVETRLNLIYYFGGLNALSANWA